MDTYLLGSPPLHLQHGRGVGTAKARTKQEQNKSSKRLNHSYPPFGTVAHRPGGQRIFTTHPPAPTHFVHPLHQCGMRELGTGDWEAIRIVYYTVLGSSIGNMYVLCRMLRMCRMHRRVEEAAGSCTSYIGFHPLYHITYYNLQSLSIQGKLLRWKLNSSSPHHTRVRRLLRQ